MLCYNTQQKPLALPEYGRNIHKMVEHCLTIEDREERTRAAYAIVRAMANLFPELKQGGQFSPKLWDHLAIMSGFQLDIDYPCEIIPQDNLHTLPDKVGYTQRPVHRRHYGAIIESMIEQAAAMPEGDERNELIRLIANQMKKDLTAINPDGADNGRIFRDIMEMSNGEIRIDPTMMKLHDYVIPEAPKGKKKKKK